MLNDKAWLQEQVNSKPIRYIANELGVPYSRVQGTIKKLGIIVPKRTKYVYAEESRRAKSELIKFRLQQKYPYGRYGELASNWRGGMPECATCGKTLSRKDAVYCLEHERSANRKGKKNINWQGGITPEHVAIRTSREYKLWRKAVFQRDNYTCQDCGARSGKGKPVFLHADHIKSFSRYPELRFAIDNGQTLCIDCHKKTDTYAGKMNRVDNKNEID